MQLSPRCIEQGSPTHGDGSRIFRRRCGALAAVMQLGSFLDGSDPPTMQISTPHVCDVARLLEPQARVAVHRPQMWHPTDQRNIQLSRRFPSGCVGAMCSQWFVCRLFQCLARVDYHIEEYRDGLNFTADLGNATGSYGIGARRGDRSQDLLHFTHRLRKIEDAS